MKTTLKSSSSIPIPGTIIDKNPSKQLEGFFVGKWANQITHSKPHYFSSKIPFILA
ncbi:hypothetical protein [Aquirufa nivalisilvae]|uniref:hypothetical protein n=1 Tax=Aquirufa nivalisilvae TaxID=2516557 RepID=UPI001379DF61|nr:hypothetical protein [Aquirufa nivalisilvae]